MLLWLLEPKICPVVACRGESLNTLLRSEKIVACPALSTIRYRCRPTVKLINRGGHRSQYSEFEGSALFAESGSKVFSMDPDPGLKLWYLKMLKLKIRLVN